jgi:hypothetical protein
LPKLKYRHPTTGQYLVAEVDNPDRSHQALSPQDPAGAHDMYWLRDGSGADAYWYRTTGGGSNSSPGDLWFTGQLTIEDAQDTYPHIYIWDGNEGAAFPHHTHIRLEAGWAGGAYGLAVLDPSDRSYRPIVVGNDVSQADTLVSWQGCIDQLTERVSGPHGPHTHWHAGAAGSWAAYPSGALRYPAIAMPGIFKVQITADLYIDNPHAYENLPEIYLGMLIRWDTWVDSGLTNGLVLDIGRLAMRQYQRGHLRTFTITSYIVNRQKNGGGGWDQLTVCGAAQQAGTSDVKYIGGDYRHTFEFFPYGTDDSAHQNGWRYS